MVFIKNSLPAADCQPWLDSVSTAFGPEEVALIRRACEFAAPFYAGKTGVTDYSRMQHALGVAAILANLRMDGGTVAAAVLHAVLDVGGASVDELRENFGSSIARLVEGVSRIAEIRHLGVAGAQQAQPEAHAESLRQMLLAMAEDIRVVLIALAEQVQTMRSLGAESEAVRRQTAREALDVFAPLANRLGVWQLKWELEDLALRYLEPELYKKIARLLDERRVDREHFIAQVIAQLKQELEKSGVSAAEISGRPKHIYSIWRKMKLKNLDFSEVYDVRAVRILVGDIKDCYTVLGIVHNLWQPIPGEFDDYIANPKSNDYRSLHTAVIGPEDKALEVQIRTFGMHRHAELGFAAHWRYKEGAKADAAFDEKIAWLRQILAWKEDVADSAEWVEQLKTELFRDRVYVLTPQGKVIDLPQDATPLDFAYHVHSDLGNRCRGAKVDDSIVPLNYKLQNAQRVEILTARQGGPSRDWLSPALGYLKSPRARAKVRHWFKYQHYEENVSAGRDVLERELHRLGIASLNQEKLAQKFGFNKLEEFLAAIGRGDVSSHQLGVAIQEQAVVPVAEAERVLPRARPPARGATSAGILVEGVGNLLTTLAKCCKPMPPEPIVGYVTRGRGITIHQRDCASLRRIAEGRADQVVAAEWGGKIEAAFAVDIEVEAHDRHGLLRDISDVLLKEKVNITKVNTISRDDQASMRFTIEVADLKQLSRVLGLIQQVPDVAGARRQG